MDKSVINKTGFFAMPEQHNVKFNNSQSQVDYRLYAVIFTNTYNYAMDLIERMSSYIEGPGRILAQSLDQSLLDIYVSETMSTSTRLMQVAAWLLLLRSAIEGDMSVEDSVAEKNKLSLDTISEKYTNTLWDRLPAGLRSLIDESLNLEARLRSLDVQLNNSNANAFAVENYVHQQQVQLRKVLNI